MVPVPVKFTVCVTDVLGEPPLLSLMVSVAGREPVANGVNVTLMVHVPLAGTDAGLIPQVSLSTYSVGSLLTILEMTKGAVPVLAIWKESGALVVVMGTPPKATVFAPERPTRLTAGAVPVPARVTLC